MTEVFIRYIHFIGILSLSSMLVVEHTLLKTQLTIAEVKRLAVVDAIYGLSAVVTFLAGLTLWLWVGKPPAFYTGNPVFHAKLGVFILLALLSILPTVFFLKHRKSGQTHIEVPKMIIHLVRLELVVLLVIPALAVLMAHGYGLA
ncbi:MAG: DUF2214 family protein [Gammaproteobacteria bacterium]|nr:DUF2214 family protein [Gammaproteobacteria bacterium]